MTVQEIGDEFTVLSHQGKAQTKVVHVSGSEVKNVTGIEMIGDDIALIKSERLENNEAGSAVIINEKLKIDVAEFVEKKNPDYKKDVIKHQTLRSLLIEFTAKREEELKANFDYILEGKDLEIKELEKENKTISRKANEAIADKLLITAKYNEVLSDLNQENGKLKKENTELKSRECWKSCEYANPKSELIAQHIKDVQQLTKAIEIIKELLNSYKYVIRFREYADKNPITKAEQFLKECK